MSIATVCKSCDGLYRSIIDRCKYCGSQHVEVKFVSEELIYRSKGRDVITKVMEKKVKKDNASSKAHSSAKEA